MEINACACMGVRPGDEYCYCQLKARGMDTSHYGWTEEEKQELWKALEGFFEKNRLSMIDPNCYNREQLFQIINNLEKEVKWLQYFYTEVRDYLGPADDDVYRAIIDEYEKTDRHVPAEYHYNFEPDF